ncbi:tetratricopeptide repeat protein [Thermoleptolyngbya sp. M55_K2018_002]|uniref:tetratricopeptide repeat protein n=1 Tax=Thermoleptolyngbya sp. M55_K2018_002 TaxID=2747808 RepID=UPI0019EBD97C|nr:tetratricopeptide repeat protein [Thermoleptolyngbya sp. M55_K2018_002]HIK40171.1 tetratricopeptide repeat protein [Thermoleptolyngbya sp. M55_K2018_002]
MKRIGRWLGIVGLAVSLCGAIALPGTTQTSRPAAVRNGYALLERGWVNDAIAAFQQALRQLPNSLDARLGLAIAYQRAGRDADAWNAYQQVLAQDATNRTALSAIGLLGGYRPEWQAGGIDALSRLLELSPNDTDARTQRALLLGYQGRYAEAFADYDRLLASNPRPAALLGAAQVYAYSGDYARSQPLFARYRTTGQAIPDGALTAYARTLAELGDPAQAIQLLETTLRRPRVPDWLIPDARSTLAIAYQLDQQLPKALQTLEPLRQQANATLPLARALSTLGRRERDPQLLQQAAELYRQALRTIAEPSLGVRLEAADVLSESVTGRAEALRIYQQLSEQYPGDRSLQVRRLVLEQQLGQIGMAALQTQLQDALQPLPDAMFERQSVAIALTQVDPPPAPLLPIYESLLQSGVDVPFLHFRIAQIHLQQRNWDDARRSLLAYQNTRLGQSDVGADLLLADLERQTGNLEASARRYESILAQPVPSTVKLDALLGLSSIRRQQGNLASVSRFYDDIRRREPDQPRAQIAQLSHQYELGELSDAAAEQALAQWLAGHSPQPAYPELYALVGALPATEQRESLYLSLLETSPNDLPIERRLLQVIAQRDPEAARSRLSEILARQDDPIAGYFIQGELAQTLGDLALASEAYERILAAQPNEVGALSALAGVRFQQRQYAAAQRLYQQVLTLRPDDLETQRVMAELYLAQDQIQRGIRQLRQVRTAQDAQGVINPTVGDRLQQVEHNLLRRRGYQPFWERY